MSVVAIATVLAHPVHTILSRPYWLDEAWVATLTKAPLWRVPRLNATTPVGFVGLAKLVPGSGDQRARLVVLGFSVLTALMAYMLVRRLRWKSRAGARLAATATAFSVALAPFSLGRNDLKQYTCDAFFALVVLHAAATVDRSSDRRSILVLAGAAVIALPFSSTSAFVSAAAFLGLLASQVRDAHYRRARDTLLVGAGTAVVIASYFAEFVLPRSNKKLETYWRRYYLAGTYSMLRSAWVRLERLDASLAVPALLFVGVFIMGIVALYGMGERTLAVAVPALWLEMMMLGRLRRYPFLDLRTSHFLLVASFVVAAVGASVALVTIGRRNTWIGITLGLALSGGFLYGALPQVDKAKIHLEDVRSPTRYVEQHRRPGDEVVVSHAASPGFSYYWPHAHIRFSPADLTKGFRAEADLADTTYVPDVSEKAVLASLRDAVGRAQEAGNGNRVFIVRSHLGNAEKRSWSLAFHKLDVRPRIIPAGAGVVLEVRLAHALGP